MSQIHYGPAVARYRPGRCCAASRAPRSRPPRGPMTTTDAGAATGSAAGARAALAVSRLQPAYQQVADQLRALIISGELVAGDRLPPEGELGASFGVSRSTVREALRSLASQGLIETTRGTTGGTFVTRIKPAAVTSYLETSIGLMSGTEE